MGETKPLDLVRQHRKNYAARRRPALIDPAPGKYLATDGMGALEDEEFSVRAQALCRAADTIRMMRKYSDAKRQDFSVSPLEIIWHAPAALSGPTKRPGSESAPENLREDAESAGELPGGSGAPWPPGRWTLLLRVPDDIEEKDLNEAVVRMLVKGAGPVAHELRLEWIEEGRCVQALHVGPWDQAGGLLTRMHEFARSQGLEFHGRLHQVFLTDPKRVPPKKLRTILRQPVRPPAPCSTLPSAGGEFNGPHSKT